MPPFATLKETYFVQAADAVLPAQPVPTTFDGCRVTPLIDGADYCAEVAAELAQLGTGPDAASNPDQFVLLANWWLGLSGGSYEAPSPFSLAVAPSSPGPSAAGVQHDDPFTLDGPGGTEVLQDILIDKAKRGVDVRVMGWVSTVASGSTTAQLLVPGIPAVNALTMESIKTLRAEPAIGAKAILNVIAHPAGAVHSKMLVIGKPGMAIGFSGGIDFAPGRWARTGHTLYETWHDVMVKVEGPAVQALYDWYKNIWWENISRPAVRFRFEGDAMPSFLPGTPVLPAKGLPVTTAGTQHVQSLRTVPQFNYAWYNCLPEPPAVSFAPNGLFEFRAAARKALRNSETYIHIEDQSFWSHELLGWANEAIKARPNVRVTLLTSGAADPNDPSFPAGYLCNAINHGLLADLTPAQIDQVRFLKRFGDTVSYGNVAVTTVTAEGPNRSRLRVTTPTDEALPKDALAGRGITLLRGDEFHVVGNPAIAKGDPIDLIVENLPGPVVPVADVYLVKRPRGITVHSKTILVDDHWALIGSANTMRRSLYTDLEHSFSFMDEAGQTVKQYRKRLWADHFRHPSPDDFDDIQAALHAWEPTWGVAGAAPARPPELELIPLPIVPDATLGILEAFKYSNFEDADSRENWGGICP